MRLIAVLASTCELEKRRNLNLIMIHFLKSSDIYLIGESVQVEYTIALNMILKLLRNFNLKQGNRWGQNIKSIYLFIQQ